MHLDASPEQETGHPGSRATTYIAHGDKVGAADLLGAKTVDHWYMIASIDVEAQPQSFAVVAFGDSITDGDAATTNGNDCSTDVLARGLQENAATQNIGILNQGIGGNHLFRSC
jgi:hypothetical protein